MLPDDPALLFEKGQTHDVPFITGSNADEVGSILSNFTVRHDYGPDRAERTIFKLFPGAARKRAATVAIFTSVARADARAMSRGHGRAYLLSILAGRFAILASLRVLPFFRDPLRFRQPRCEAEIRAERPGSFRGHDGLLGAVCPNRRPQRPGPAEVARL